MTLNTVAAANSSVMARAPAQRASATERSVCTMRFRHDGGQTKSSVSVLPLVHRNPVGLGLGKMGAMSPTTSTRGKALALRIKLESSCLLCIRGAAWYYRGCSYGALNMVFQFPDEILDYPEAVKPQFDPHWS